MNTDEHGWKTNFFLSYLCPSVFIRGKKSSQKHATLGYSTAKTQRKMKEIFQPRNTQNTQTRNHKTKIVRFFLAAFSAATAGSRI